MWIRNKKEANKKAEAKLESLQGEKLAKQGDQIGAMMADVTIFTYSTKLRQHILLRIQKTSYL